MDPLNHFCARNSSPMPRRKVFSSPVAGFRIDLKIRLTASMGSTAGKYISIRCKVRQPLQSLGSAAHANPKAITVFIDDRG